MGRPILSRYVLGWLLLLAVMACGGDQPPLEELYHAGYSELARGSLKTAAERADTGRTRARSERQPTWEWAFRVLEAEILASRRDNARALALLASGPRSTPLADAVEVRASMTRGLIRCRSGEGPEAFAEGDAILDQAARAADELGSIELRGEVALRRGTCRFLEQRWDEAEALFEQALDAARRAEVRHLEANAAGSLGLVRIRTDRFDEATDWLHRSREIAESIDAAVPLAKTINNLGWCYFELGDYRRAVTMLSEAKARAAALGLDGDRLVAQINLGRALMELGELSRARSQFLRALALARELGDRRRMARLLSNLAAVDLEERRFDSAEAYLDDALALKEALGDSSGRQHSLFVRARILIERGRLDEAETLCHQLIESPHTPTIQLWEAHGALGRVHAGRGRSEAAEAQLRLALELFEASRSELREVGHRLSFFANYEELYDAYIELLVESGRQRAALDMALESRARMLRERLRQEEAKSTENVDPVAVARAADAVLLVYWTAPERSLLWVAHRDGVELRYLPDEARLAAGVEAYGRKIQRSADPLTEALAEGEELWRLLVAPAADFLPPGSRVVVIPDGPLYSLAFDTLVVPGSRPHYWLEDVVLASAPTLAAAGRLDRTAVRTGSILLLGDPLSADPSYPRLQHAGREIRQIAELFPPAASTIRAGGAAQPTTYARSRPWEFDYVHLAAHVTAHREIPLDSAILLSPEGESFKLYARDIVEVPLGARLVTLSACHGAGSRTYAGEGLVGLAWAFLGAGAQSVIGGLWEVEDASTSELMTHLYRGLSRGLDPEEALREAKLHLLRSSSAWRKPYYWAPFVIYHGPRALAVDASP